MHFSASRQDAGKEGSVDSFTKSRNRMIGAGTAESRDKAVGSAPDQRGSGEGKEKVK